MSYISEEEKTDQGGFRISAKADLLALVCGVHMYYCEFVTFPLVFWVRCGTLLYRFLIFALLLTFICIKEWEFAVLILSHFCLTHFSRMEFPIVINWTIPFPF